MERHLNELNEVANDAAGRMPLLATVYRRLGGALSSQADHIAGETIDQLLVGLRRLFIGWLVAPPPPPRRPPPVGNFILKKKNFWKSL
jgi:hypothetical protein